MRQTRNSKNQSGYTILESIVALFIFSFVSIAILTGLGVADRIHSRAFVAMNATRIAENEFEQIHKKALFLEAIEDCTWVVTSNGREFQIARRILLPDSVRYQNSKPSLLEIELSIETKPSNQQKYQFRMMQGYSW